MGPRCVERAMIAGLHDCDRRAATPVSSSVFYGSRADVFVRMQIGSVALSSLFAIALPLQSLRCQARLLECALGFARALTCARDRSSDEALFE